MVYRNWLGLMKCDLSEEVTRAARGFIRKLHSDLKFTTPDGKASSLKGRSLHAGPQCTAIYDDQSAILDRDGNEDPGRHSLDAFPDRI